MCYWKHHGMTNKNKEIISISMKCTYGGLAGNDRFSKYWMDLMAENSRCSFTQKQRLKLRDDITGSSMGDSGVTNRCDSWSHSHYHLRYVLHVYYVGRKLSQNTNRQIVYLILAISSSILFVARTAGGTSTLLACVCLASTNLPYNAVCTKAKKQPSSVKNVLRKMQSFIFRVSDITFSLRMKNKLTSISNS